METTLKRPPHRVVSTADTPGLRCAATTLRCAQGSYCGRRATQTLKRPGGTSALPLRGALRGMEQASWQAEARQRPSGSNQIHAYPGSWSSRETS